MRYQASVLLINHYGFFTPTLADSIHWSLRDSKSIQISKTLLNIRADLINAVVWIVSIHPSISNSYNPFSKPLEIVLSAPFTTDFTVTLYSFDSFLSSLSRSEILSLYLLSLIFSLWSAGTLQHVLFFMLFITWSGLLARISGSTCISIIVIIIPRFSHQL